MPDPYQHGSSVKNDGGARNVHNEGYRSLCDPTIMTRANFGRMIGLHASVVCTGLKDRKVFGNTLAWGLL